MMPTGFAHFCILACTFVSFNAVYVNGDEEPLVMPLVFAPNGRVINYVDSNRNIRRSQHDFIDRKKDQGDNATETTDAGTTGSPNNNTSMEPTTPNANEVPQASDTQHGGKVFATGFENTNGQQPTNVQHTDTQASSENNAKPMPKVFATGSDSNDNNNSPHASDPLQHNEMSTDAAVTGPQAETTTNQETHTSASTGDSANTATTSVSGQETTTSSTGGNAENATTAGQAETTSASTAASENGTTPAGQAETTAASSAEQSTQSGTTAGTGQEVASGSTVGATEIASSSASAQGTTGGNEVPQASDTQNGGKIFATGFENNEQATDIQNTNAQSKPETNPLPNVFATGNNDTQSSEIQPGHASSEAPTAEVTISAGETPGNVSETTSAGTTSEGAGSEATTAGGAGSEATTAGGASSEGTSSETSQATSTTGSEATTGSSSETASTTAGSGSETTSGAGQTGIGSEATTLEGANTTAGGIGSEATTTAGGTDGTTGSAGSEAITVIDAAGTTGGAASEATTAVGGETTPSSGEHVTSGSSGTGTSLEPTTPEAGTTAAGSEAGTTATPAPTETTTNGNEVQATDTGASGLLINSGSKYAKSSGQAKTCQRQADCYTLREPDEWCPMPENAKFFDKGCFCEAKLKSCVIERSLGGSVEYSDCQEESTSKCVRRRIRISIKARRVH